MASEGEFITDAANILETSEYEIFRRAYRHWYGSDPSEELLDTLFGAYLRHQTYPAWARHYSREVVIRFERENRTLFYVALSRWTHSLHAFWKGLHFPHLSH